MRRPERRGQPVSAAERYPALTSCRYRSTSLMRSYGSSEHSESIPEAAAGARPSAASVTFEHNRACGFHRARSFRCARGFRFTSGHRYLSGSSRAAGKD